MGTPLPAGHRVIALFLLVVSAICGYAALLGAKEATGKAPEMLTINNILGVASVLGMLVAAALALPAIPDSWLRALDARLPTWLRLRSLHVIDGIDIHAAVATLQSEAVSIGGKSAPAADYLLALGDEMSSGLHDLREPAIRALLQRSHLALHSFGAYVSLNALLEVLARESLGDASTKAGHDVWALSEPGKAVVRLLRQTRVHRP